MRKGIVILLYTKTGGVYSAFRKAMCQFEILHPFLDGNGRLGRLLIPLSLYEKQVLSRPMFYLSAYLESHRKAYVSRLRALNGRESWNRWIAFFLRVLREANVLESLREASGRRPQVLVSLVELVNLCEGREVL